ncbi:MAG: endonuclease MutS2 [SAR202 cluster bacterium]|nr:endonuclease MutS2 [SAR202 cluster bacterium]
MLLEFPKVRDLLVARTHFFVATELAHQLRPSVDQDLVDRLQRETAEARLFLDARGDIGLIALPDPRPALSRASLGGSLSGAELVAISVALDATWQARAALKPFEERIPHLHELASRIGDFRQLKRAIDHALSEKGDVLDRASPELGPLRRKVATSYNRLVRHLERMTSDGHLQRALQSSAIATRGDRLVLEVKIEDRKAVPGIVHDVSKSGLTLFVEPFGAVEICNDWRETSAEAAREEERILRSLSEMAAERAAEALDSIAVAGEIDLIFARARLAHDLRAVRPEIRSGPQEAAVQLVDARHPLLGAGAVPLSLWVGPGFSALVITGPNTGGKTVALKTAGLLALMHQAGLQIPANSGSALRIFDGIFADIGDAQSIERSVSTFSSHIGNVVEILEGAGPESLVLIDELGTGTDPEEGSALARAVLEELAERRIPAIVTTHHRTVADFAGRREGMENASVDLDPDTMLPTYRFAMGLPGRSYAITVAARLGLKPSIIDAARGFLSSSHVDSEQLLRELQSERKKIAAAAGEAEADRTVAADLRRQLESRLASLATGQEDLLASSRRDLDREVSEVRALLKDIEDRARSTGELSQALAQIDRVRQRIRDKSWAAPQRAPGAPVRPPERPLAVGDVVEVKGLGVRAEVEGFNSDGRVDLLMGAVRVALDEGELRRVDGAQQSRLPKRVSFDAAPADTVTTSLDLRGMRAHEVEDKVAAFLDRCTLMGLRSARIVHGRGTGAVRQAVREALARHPSAAAFSPAEPSAGGDGVTVVELA